MAARVEKFWTKTPILGGLHCRLRWLGRGDGDQSSTLGWVKRRGLEISKKNGYAWLRETGNGGGAMFSWLRSCERSLNNITKNLLFTKKTGILENMGTTQNQSSAKIILIPGLESSGTNIFSNLKKNVFFFLAWTPFEIVEYLWRISVYRQRFMYKICRFVWLTFFGFGNFVFSIICLKIRFFFTIFAKKSFVRTNKSNMLYPINCPQILSEKASVQGFLFSQTLQESPPPPPRTGVKSPPVGQTLGSGESPDGGYV